MVNVAIVTPRYPPTSAGGGEQSTKLLATQLVNYEPISDVTVFSLDGSGHDHQNGVDVRRLGEVSSFITELQNLRAFQKLSDRLDEFDIVHSYNMELTPVVGYLSNRNGVPSVATLNSYHFFRKAATNTTANRLERLYEIIGVPTTGRLLRRYMYQNDAFIVLSRASRNLYCQKGLDVSSAVKIPNMIDPSFEVSGNGSSGTELLYVGSLTENKGVQYLIKALAQIPESYELRIVGDGERRELLTGLAVRLGVDDRITFSGWVPYDDIGEVYSTADVFVHPGIWQEPFGRTVLEAMQAELPVVCTDIGGPPEVVPQEELICEPANPKDLAAAIQRVERVSDDVGKQNRRHVTAKYSPSVVMPQIIDLYKCLLDR